MDPDDKIMAKFSEILKPFVPESHTLSGDTDLVADLGLDSLKVMKIVESVEDAFDISIPLNVLPDVRTARDFVLQIQKICEDDGE